MKVWKSVGLGQIIYIPSGTAIAIRSGIDTKSPPQWPHFGQRLKCQSGKQWVKHVWNMRILVKETESSKISTVLPLPTPGTWHIIKDISIKSNELKAKFLDSSMWSRTHIGKELKTFKCLRFELKVYAPLICSYVHMFSYEHLEKATWDGSSHKLPLEPQVEQVISNFADTKDSSWGFGG
jgi:hypothetical protein